MTENYFLRKEDVVERVESYPFDCFIDAFADRRLDRMIIDSFLQDGCTIEDLQTLFKSLPEFGAEREREDVYTRGELIMHTLARFVMHYAKTDMVYETDPEKRLGPPEGRNPLTEEEQARSRDELAGFENEPSLSQNMQAILIKYFMQHVESEDHAIRAIELLSQDGFRTHFARYLTALTRPDLLQRDRPDEKPLEKSDDLKEYRIYRSGVPLPSLGELEKAFSGSGSVSNLFDGRPFDRNPAYKDAFDGPGESILAVRSFGWQIRSEETIDKMKNTHYPAVETDLYELSLIYPALESLNWLFAFGSSMKYSGLSYVAVLHGYFGRRVLDGDVWLGDRWHEGGRFLFVRK